MALPSLSSRRGSAVVDYLILTAVVAGILIPIVFKYFGEPIQQSLFSQRGKLVEFVAQTPVRPGKHVPNAWFGQQPPPRIATNDIQEPGAIQDTEIKQPTDLKDTGKIEEPRKISEGRRIETKPIQEPKRIQTSPIGSGGGGGGGGAGEGSGAGVGGGNLDDSFFGDGKGGAGAGAGGAGDDGAGAGSAGGRRRAGSEFSEEGGGTGRGDSLAGGKRGSQGGEKGDNSSKSVAENKSKQNVLVQQAQEEEKVRSGGWNFWALLRIIVLALILFLVILIGLSNVKKR